MKANSRTKVAYLLMSAAILGAHASGGLCGEIAAPLLLAGENEREYGSFVCEQDLFFTAGLATTGPMRLGGDTSYCDSEWGFSTEFDLSALPVSIEVDSASVVINLLDYNQQLQVGVYTYPANGLPVQLNRYDITAANAQALFAANSGPLLRLAVGDAVRQAVTEGKTRIGFFFAPVPSALGTDNLVTVSGTATTVPPTLTVWTAAAAGVQDHDLPVVVTLEQNCPNPFNPQTMIKFDLPEAGPVSLSVFDVAGRLVRTLVNDTMPQGSHEAIWDGRDASGREVGSGSYLARLEFGGKVETVRMGLIR